MKQTHNDRIAQRIFKMQERWQVQMREQMFDASDTMYILSFSKSLSTAYGFDKISQNVATWLIKYYTEKLSITALSSRLQLKFSR